MTIRNLTTFNIAIPVFFGLSALGAVKAGIYAPAFLCALFSFVFTRFGWQLSCRWLQLPDTFYRFRWWCVGGAFLVWAGIISAINAEDAGISEQKRTVELAREAAKAKREAEKDPFAHLFSAWDGSCRPLVAAVKTNLKDPGSFEHIKTGFYRVNDVVHVTMTYRARNSFNGYTVGKAKAEVYADGKVANLSFE
jgi:hypothetical protein